jgi:predicted small metal-binding protein
MKEFTCGDVVPHCDFKASGDTEDEILGKVAEHAREAHGMDEVPDEVVTQVREKIRDV